jgi:6-pyruvoyltetrahydropterin/6-carboxytetrahydropterin synthase
MIITKEFTFDSAHKLQGYAGKCANLHGHTYKLQVSVQGKLNKQGMVIDFLELKKIVHEQVLSVLDHNYLNDIIENPTAENITIWIWEKLKTCIPLCELKLWETPSSFTTYRGD